MGPAIGPPVPEYSTLPRIFFFKSSTSALPFLFCRASAVNSTNSAESLSTSSLSFPTSPFGKDREEVGKDSAEVGRVNLVILRYSDHSLFGYVLN